jgi:hypothetical protein
MTEGTRGAGMRPRDQVYDKRTQLWLRGPGVPATEEQLLLRKQVLHAAEAEPARFAMNAWEGESECGTTYCLGGWAITLSGQRVTDYGFFTDLSIAQEAVTLLGLSLAEFCRPEALLFFAPAAVALPWFREITENPL